MIDAMIEESDFGTVPINPQVRHRNTSSRDAKVVGMKTDLVQETRRSMLVEQHDNHHLRGASGQYSPSSRGSSP